MDKFKLNFEADSIDDSRGECQLDRLNEELKRKNGIIEEKAKIIASLRQQVSDLQQDADDLETNEQLLKQKVDKLEKELGQKNEELEAISHALKEVELANETLSKRLDARTSQLQKFVEDLADSKKKFNEVQNINEQLQHQNELLNIELESTKSRKRNSRDCEDEEAFTLRIRDLETQVNVLKQQNINLVAETRQQKQELDGREKQNREFERYQDELKQRLANLQKQNERLASEFANMAAKKQSFSTSDREQTNEEMVQELYDLRAQVKSLSHRQSRRSIDEEILRLKQELDLTETSWRLEKQHKERYARENCQLDKKVNELTKELDRMAKRCTNLESRCAELEADLRQKLSSPTPPLPPKTNVQLADQDIKSDLTSAIHFSMADEVGEIMDSSSVKSVLSKEKRLLSESSMRGQHDCIQNKRAALNSENPLPRRTVSATSTHCANHRIQKSQLFNDPLLEQRMRLERANELARRNMQTKPLHQTSYALELDTFDTIGLSENDIKRGNVPRPPLVDTSNQRKPVKKSEAFIF